MELLLNTQEERCRMEVYNEYLRKIPQLLTQLEAVEKMYEKAVLEEQMLKDKDPQDHSVQLYAQRLASTRQQCEVRMADIHRQCHKNIESIKGVLFFVMRSQKSVFPDCPFFILEILLILLIIPV